MSEGKHTPGPWRARKDSDDIEWVVLSPDPGSDLLLNVVCFNIDSRADANLIAAAPDLLAACESAAEEATHADGCIFVRMNISEITALPKDAPEPCNCFLRDVRAAIAKARGESNAGMDAAMTPPEPRRCCPHCESSIAVRCFRPSCSCHSPEPPEPREGHVHTEYANAYVPGAAAVPLECPDCLAREQEIRALKAEVARLKDDVKYLNHLREMR